MVCSLHSSGGSGSGFDSSEQPPRAKPPSEPWDFPQTCTPTAHFPPLSLLSLPQEHQNSADSGQKLQQQREIEKSHSGTITDPPNHSHKNPAPIQVQEQHNVGNPAPGPRVEFRLYLEIQILIFVNLLLSAAPSPFYKVLGWCLNKQN